jgi:serine/threonine protein kinase
MSLLTEEEIFNAALQKPAAERAAFLDRACQGDTLLRAAVEALVAAHEVPDSFLEAPLGEATIEQPTERLGTQIGPYKLLQQIGEGGFGVVYMAEQLEPVRRKVALKVIKPGMDTRQVIARFEAERQALAVMDHPNIARVFDAGTTESGRPYFVMELVRGTPITQYCDENQLQIRERLEIFATVCQAIQHAHTKGIIHRDIKPTNVLVTRQDGQPVVKVIDFGVAKAMGQQLTEKTLFTEFAQMIGTPLYMSPEQAELSSVDIDTRSDIYSLGVLLYELLTGSTPVTKEQLKQAAFDEIRRIIREEEPQKPSTRISTAEAAPSIAAQRHTEPAKLAKLVRGELDWIVMKALEKDRNRRYETASGFAADLQRYLADEPVQACPPSVGYRFRKFARRNKAALVTTSLVAGALLASVAVLAISNVRITQERNQKVEALRQKEQAFRRKDEALKEASEQRQLAMENLKKARQAVDQMLTRVAQQRLADQPEMQDVRRDLLEDALKFYQGFLQQASSDPSIRAETGLAYLRVGEISRFLFGDLGRANENFVRALPLLQQATVDFPGVAEYRHELGRCHNGLAVCLAAAGRLEEAEREHRKALEQFEQEGQMTLITGQERRVRQELAWTYLNLGKVLDRRRPDDAQEAFHEVIALCEKLDAEFPNESYYQSWMASAFLRLARLMTANGAPAEADKLYRRFNELKPASAFAANSMAWTLATYPDLKIRDPKRAVELARKAVDLKSTPAHWNTLGVALYRAGEWNEAVKTLNRAIELRQGGNAIDWFFLAMANWQLGEKDQAREWYGRAVEWMEAHAKDNAELIRFRAEAEELMK